MKLIFSIIFLSHALVLIPSGLTAQVKMYSVISPQVLNKDDYATYRIVIENPDDIQDITPPSFKNFTIVSGPVQEQGITRRTTGYTSLVFVLKPAKTGRFTINPAMARIAGKTYKSNTLSLLVKNSVTGTGRQSNLLPIFNPFTQQSPRTDFSDYIFHQGEDINSKVNRNMQLRLEVNKTTCYVGEPIIAVYNIYTRLKSESKLTQTPSFNGFSVIDIQDPAVTDYTKKKLNGREYNVYTIRKAQLYALQPGDISIEEAALENNIQFIKNEYARQIADAGRMFDDFANAIFPAEAVINETVTLKSDPVNITVKPLPEKNKPDFFNGAVGTFSIDAMLQKPLFSTDEAGKLSVMISGSGNMQLLTAPDIEWPKGIESFEPVFSDDLVKTTVPVSGTKKFEYSFAANDTGHYTLPPIRFSYFDPVAGNYKIIATAPIVFQVTKGSGHPVLLAAPVVKAEEPSFINRFIYHRWWIIIIVGLLIIGGLITWLIKERLPAAVNASGQQTADAGVIEQVIESSAINQQNVFSGTEKCMSQDDCIGFYNVLNTELKQFLAQKFLIDVNHINSNSITRVMDKKGIENKIVLKLQELMQKLEWQLYAPFERNEKMNTLYQEAHDIVQMINFNEITHL